MLFVAKSFSVTFEDGIKGFPAGKEVRFIRAEGEEYIVSDGEIEARASIDSFTNDLDEVDALRENAMRDAKAIEQSRLQQQRIAAEREASERKIQEQNMRDSQKEKWLKEVAALKAQRDALNKRINTAAKERESKGYPRYGGPKSDGRFYSREVTSLGADASQIEQLLKAKEQIDTRLNQLGSKQ